MHITLANVAPFILLAFLAGLGMGLSARNLAHYYRGHRDGRNEERSRQNARIIPAKLEGCHRGRKAERDDALRPYRFDLRVRPRVTVTTDSPQ